jgi:hypothetical protein
VKNKLSAPAVNKCAAGEGLQTTNQLNKQTNRRDGKWKYCIIGHLFPKNLMRAK